MNSRYDPNRYAMPPSGNAEQDEAEIRAFIARTALMDEGMCPNRCGPRLPGMGADDATPEDGGSYCPACGFVCNTDLPTPAAQQEEVPGS